MVPLHPDDVPLAYLVTFTCYGTWFHGSDRGSVDLEHNVPGTAVLPRNPSRERSERRTLTQTSYELNAERRSIVLGAIQEVCRFRKWPLFAAHVRTSHVHVVVQAYSWPEIVMSTLKAYASRQLKDAGVDSENRKRWTRHGSNRWIWKLSELEAAINYVVSEQGSPMAVFEDLAATALVESLPGRPTSEPRP